jgi:hypothetical protein
MKRLALIVLAVAAAFLTFVSRTRSAPQFSDDMLREAQRKADEYRRTAIRVNDLAGAIHTEQDARAFVDAVGQAVAEQVPYALTAPLRERVARAEFAAVSDPSKLIPEQRVAEAWNRWVTDVNGPIEARVTPAEIHNLRDASFASAEGTWPKYQSFWSMPNVYAATTDGRLADGCRPLEALLILHDINHLFVNLLSARERVAKGILASGQIRKHFEEKGVTRKATLVSMAENPAQRQLRHAEEDYFESHGEVATTVRVLQLVSQVLGDE